MSSKWKASCSDSDELRVGSRPSHQEGSLAYEDNVVCGSRSDSSQAAPVDLSESELNQLFASSMPRLLRVAKRVMRNAEDSEDVLQDGLLSAFLKLDQFQRRAKFSTWMHSIILNTAKMHLRKSASHKCYSLDEQPENSMLHPFEAIPDRRPDAEQLCAEHERSQILRGMLSGLRSSHRAVIQLCDIEGLNGREAAARLGISISLLKTNLHRARRLVARKTREATRSGNQKACTAGHGDGLQLRLRRVPADGWQDERCSDGNKSLKLDVTPARSELKTARARHGSRKTKPRSHLADGLAFVMHSSACESGCAHAGD